ncbi:MAG: SPOR domain-containing protein [Candidatus Rifleibacteriota bacterium]
MNDNQQDSSEYNRQFDWGPPANSWLDKFKEMLVYLIFIALLALGAWFLLDVSGKKNLEKPLTGTLQSNKVNKDIKATEQVARPQKEKKTSNIKYLVQLGAFASKESAQMAFDALKTEGFSPTLSEPDEQYEIYRVSLGPFSDEAEAEYLAEKLNSLEFHSFVIEYR